MKYLGVDYGESKIGLALGDNESGVATPFKIVKNKNQTNTLKELAEICRSEKIDVLVFGWPVNGHGVSRQMARVEDFAKHLAKQCGLPLFFSDERFTTSQAKRIFSGSHEDAVAAMLILQDYLDRKK